MNWYILVILLYLVALTIYNFRKSSAVRNQEDMMVAGRSLGVTRMVFTLVCTWIGSGTFIAGAEYAYKAGWSSLWLPAGAWFGIGIIYFLAAKSGPSASTPSATSSRSDTASGHGCSVPWP